MIAESKRLSLGRFNQTHGFPAPAKRLVSLDAFRGAVIGVMVLVNNPGGSESYSQLEHAKWNGWTLADTVFPSFLWIAGVSIALSLGKRKQSDVVYATLLRFIGLRAAILFMLGLFLALYPDFHFATVRIPGVLQRIAVCYFAASAVFLFCNIRAQLLWMAGLLIAYYLLMTTASVPGIGPGHLDEVGNFAFYVDRVVFGPHRDSTMLGDPEGIISTLPAIASTLLGVLAGNALISGKRLRENIGRFLVIGSLLVIFAWLCSYWMPVNKKLWSISYVFSMAGLDFVVFALFAFFVDERGCRSAVRPLIILGVNAIAIYMFAELLAGTFGKWDIDSWVYENTFAAVASPVNASLLYAVSFVLVTYAFARVLYQRGWFWKV